jgi:hypothetical protein
MLPGMTGMTYKRAAQLMEAELGDELVTLDVQRGDCFGFNAVAKDVWNSLSTPKTFEQLRNELLSEYDVTVEQCTVDLQALLDEFAERGWVETVS